MMYQCHKYPFKHFQTLHVMIFKQIKMKGHVSNDRVQKTENADGGGLGYHKAEAST